MTLTRNQVSKLEVSLGRKSNVGRGALVGAGVGLAVGAIAGGIIGASWPDAPEPAWLTGAAALGAIGLGAGVGTGALIGAISRAERWEELPISRVMSASAGHAGNLGIFVSLNLASDW